MLHLTQMECSYFGRKYLIAVDSWQAGTLHGLSLQSLTNLDSNRMSICANVDYRLSDNLYLIPGYHRFSGGDFNFSSQNPTGILFVRNVLWPPMSIKHGLK